MIKAEDIIKLIKIITFITIIYNRFKKVKIKWKKKIKLINTISRVLEVYIYLTKNARFK